MLMPMLQDESRRSLVSNQYSGLVDRLSQLDLASLEVMHSSRVRSNGFITSELNLMWQKETGDATLLLMIKHREHGDAMSFEIEVFRHSGLDVAATKVRDVDCPVEMRRVIDGMVARLSIVDEA